MVSTKEIKELLNTTDEGKWGHWVFTRLSVYLTKILLMLPITANQVTILSTILGIIGVLFMTSKNDFYYIFGFLFICLYWILDFSDGVIARYKNCTSVRGKYLDSLGHLLVHPLMFLAIGVHLFNKSGDILYLVIGLAVALVFIFYFTNHKIYQVLNENKEKETKDNVSKKFSLSALGFKIQKSIRYLINVVAYFLLAKLIEYILSLYEIRSLYGINLNLTFYLLCFYLIVYSLLFFWQSITYYKNLPGPQNKS